MNSDLFSGGLRATSPSVGRVIRTGGRGVLDKAASLTAGLISYWKLDEGPGTRVDSMGAHNLADKVGDLSGATAGIINTCAGHFGFSGSGTNGALWTADNADFKMGAGKSFTVAGWTFAAGSGSNTRTMGSKWGAAIGSQEYIFYANQSADTFWYLWLSVIENGTTQKNIDGFAGGAQFRNFAAAWHFFAYGYDAANQLAFLKVPGSNVIQTLTVACTNINGTTADFALGNVATYNSAHWGWLDETGFWNRVLTDAELLRVYNAGTGLPLSSF